jgi:hypothetical protein
MIDGISIIEHLNAFNIVLSQLLSVDIEIIEEDTCISMVCSLPDSWDSLVIVIGTNTTTLMLEDMVAYLLSKEMRWKKMEGSTKDSLIVRGQLIEKGRGKFFGRQSKSKCRSKSLV